MFFIIGSRAFDAYFPNLVTPKDLDLIGSREDFLNFIEARGEDIEGDLTYKGGYKITARSKEFGLIECELIQDWNSSARYDGVFGSPSAPYAGVDMNGFHFRFAPVPMQYSIKLSHIFHPINWEKHIFQFHHLNKAMEGKDCLATITKVRVAETEAHFGKLKTPSLMKADKESFFLDSVEKIRVFDHDEIHRVVAYEKDSPMFRKMQPDITKVACSKEMWNEMSYDDQCAAVLEEAFVIALERLILPYLFIGKPYVSEEKALKWALMRICTTLCSGWFRKFARDNYFAILARAQSESSYVSRFLEKYEAGDIKRIDRYKKFQ